MSRLSDLFKDLPADVPSVSFGSLMTRIRERGKDDESVAQVYVVSNTQGMVRAEDYRENTIHSEDTSNYTVIRPGMIAYNPSRLNIGSIAMLKDDEPGLVSPMYVVFSIDQSKVEKEYFELLMKSSHLSSRINALKEEGARFRFDYTRWDWIKVPLPPKTIQQEVGNTLKVFQDLINSLTSELDARKKQYIFYQKKLMTFDETIPVKKLGDIVSVCMCKRIKKEQTASTGDIPFYKNGTLGKKADSFISQELFEEYSQKYKFPNVGEVMLSTAGTVGRAIKYDGKPAFFQDSNVVWLKNNCSQVTNEYLYWFCMSMPWKLPSRGTIKHLHNDMILETEITIPSFEEQHRIATTLDSFYELCINDSSGLKAELKARQKQYNFYRDKLLELCRLS